VSTVSDQFKHLKDIIEAKYPVKMNMMRHPSAGLIVITFKDTRTKEEFKLRVNEVSLKYTTTHQAIMDELDRHLEKTKFADSKLYKKLNG